MNINLLFSDVGYLHLSFQGLTYPLNFDNAQVIGTI